MRVVFMGTPEFAVPSLQAIHKAGYNIVGVVTAPDKEIGRGRKKISVSAVKKEAQRLGLPILQPPRLKRKSFIRDLKSLNADIQVVVAFRMLPELVWDMPPLGTYNLHGSLLPKYRGAAPIHWAVINGEKETGVTTFKLQHEIDTGNIALQRSLPIGENETTGEVYEKLMHIGAELIVETLSLIEKGDLTLISQKDLKKEVSHAPKLNKESGLLDFSSSARSIKNMVRGLNPYPGAWTKIGNKEVKIWAVDIDYASNIKEGQWKSDNKTYIKIGTRKGTITVLELQLEGKKRMRVTDFLNGYDFNKLANITL